MYYSLHHNKYFTKMIYYNIIIMAKLVSSIFAKLQLIFNTMTYINIDNMTEFFVLII